jgi:hypothetical protein
MPDRAIRRPAAPDEREQDGKARDVKVRGVTARVGKDRVGKDRKDVEARKALGIMAELGQDLVAQESVDRDRVVQAGAVRHRCCRRLPAMA